MIKEGWNPNEPIKFDDRLPAVSTRKPSLDELDGEDDEGMG
jgi:hypothetical protein